MAEFTEQGGIRAPGTGGYGVAVPFLRAFWLFMLVYRMWRRLPARQRRQALVLAGRHGPKLATRAMSLRRRRP